MLLCLLFAIKVDAQARRLRLRQRPIPQQEPDNLDQDEIEEENTPSPAIQYYNEPRNNFGQGGRVVLVSSDDDYNGVYGQQTSPPPRARVDYNRPIAKSTTVAPRTKDPGTKPPPVQTIRNYSKVNDDGSFTFGYEAADGSFKEETRGTDCVVRGKYGYIDPDGNKREFTYVSGNPCDPNQPNDQDDEEDRSREDSNEQENIPQNYPRRPIKPIARPIPTTTPHTPTTVFQNTYSSAAYGNDEEEEDEQPEPIQLLQQPQRPRITQRPQPIHQLQTASPDEVTIRQRPRITVTTPAPIAYQTPARPSSPVSITPRPAYRISPTPQPQPQRQRQTLPPATTYRPAVQFITQKPTTLSYSTAAPSHLTVEPITKQSYSSSRKPVDFASEFQKFQLEHNVLQSTTIKPSTHKPFKPSPVQNVELPNPTSNPIYESQLVFDPSTGQYDSALYQQLPQSDGDFALNHRIQPYVHQPQFQPSPLLNIEQPQPIYNRQIAQPSRASPLQFPQFDQQLYHQDQENKNVLSSQQLFLQQQQLQQQQLQQDRLEAAKRQQGHRFNAPSVRQPQPGFYFVQPQESSGQIEAFLRGHNLDLN